MSKTDPGGEWVPGENAGDVSELERVGRLTIGHQLYDHADALLETADDVLDRAFDGEDIRREDLEAIRREMNALEFVLETYAEPVAEQREREEGNDDE